MRKTLRGPAGLILELDRTEVFPDDPGAGTPALVRIKHDYVATFWCASDTGLLHGRNDDYSLSPAQSQWLNEQEEMVNKFLYE